MQTEAAGLISLVSGGLLGLFGGVGATMLWEGIVLPIRERRRVARLLLAELRQNSHQIAWAIGFLQTSDDAPPNLHLSTFIFDSLTDKVAEMPEEMIQSLITLRLSFVNLNDLAAAFVDMTGKLEGEEDEIARKKAMAQIDAWRQQLLKGLRQTGDVLAGLMPQVAACAALSSEPPPSSKTAAQPLGT